SLRLLLGAKERSRPRWNPLNAEAKDAIGGATLEGGEWKHGAQKEANFGLDRAELREYHHPE
ncbi:MAG TPA: hypothetical protein VKG78_00385, partial [Opitutaceae bacterium]|nr:hypothetical protein [Opitutaceae bacterium]